MQALGGASVILATAHDSKAISSLVDGLGPDGKVVIVGAGAEPLTITPLQLIFARRTVRGWPSGAAQDSEDTLQFSSLSGVSPHDRTLSLEKVAEAYDQLISGRARFRVVLTMGG